MSNEIIAPQGDDVTITASINDQAGNDLDITGATITFTVYDGSVQKFAKTATIVTASTGAISIAIADADTSSLSGAYIYKIKVTDASSNVSTVRVSQFLVPTNQNMADKEKVRILLGDTDTSDLLLTDAQIYFFLFENANVYTAASKAAGAIQSKFSRLADTTIESVSVKYSQKADNYAKLSQDLKSQAEEEDLVLPSVLGVSIDAMNDARDNTDRPTPKFEMDRFSNPQYNSEYDRYD